MHRSAQVALLALITGIGIALTPVAAQTNPPQPPTPPAAPAAPVQSQCAEVPAVPPMPDGAHATRAQMEAYSATFATWTNTSRAARQCRLDEVNAVRARSQPLVDEYNVVNNRVTAINTYWTAYVNQLNAESGGTTQARGCQQQQHDIVAGEFHNRCDSAPTNVDPNSGTGEAATTATSAAALPDISTLGTGPVTPANPLSNCAAIAEPARPLDPTNRRQRAQIPQSITTYNAWLADANEKLACRRVEANAITAQARELARERDASDQMVTNAPVQWNAEIAEFTARSGH